VTLFSCPRRLHSGTPYGRFSSVLNDAFGRLDRALFRTRRVIAKTSRRNYNNNEWLHDKLVEAVGIEPVEAADADSLHSSDTTDTESTQLPAKSDIASEADSCQNDKYRATPVQNSDTSLHKNYAVFRTDSEYIGSLIAAVAESNMSDSDKRAVVRCLSAVKGHVSE